MVESSQSNALTGVVRGTRVDENRLSAIGAARMEPAAQYSPPRAADRRHICVVTETYPPEINGVALTMSQLVRGLRARGHFVSVVRPDQHRPCSSDDSLPTLVRGLPLPGYRGLRFGLPCARLLRKSWRHNRPDVIYVATEGPLGWSAVRIARCLGIPIVSGFHTNYHYYSQHYRLGCLQDLIFKYLCWFHNQTARTLVPCAEIASRLTSVGVANIGLLERGVDGKLFSPERRSADLRRQWGVGDEGLAAIYVGRVAREKNLELAVDAYHAMKRVDQSLKFVIVGDGPLREPLQRSNPDLIFLGTHIGEALAARYASADIFIFPSITETFGNVTLEAMASGLAVTAYDYAAAGMHITHRDSGMLAPYDNAKAFVESAVSLVRDPDALSSMRRRAREHVSSFDWPRVVDRFENLLMSVRHSGRTAPPSSMAEQGLAV
jgi:glycosyltransferase involved in cell wall biosynthesis